MTLSIASEIEALKTRVVYLRQYFQYRQYLFGDNTARNNLTNYCLSYRGGTSSTMTRESNRLVERQLICFN